MATVQSQDTLSHGRRCLSSQHTVPNPRRSSSDQSVSLPPHKRQKLHHDELYSSPRGPQDTAQGKLLRDCSQGSSNDLSGPKWFDTANNHVVQNIPLQSGFADEPPFFMSTEDRYKLPAQTSTDSDEPFGARVQIDSEKEELRDVIDDLTVENKKLKLMLRSYKGRSLSHVDVRDALFEVKLHGLPAGKKRELEVLLQHFASSLHVPRSTKPSSSAAKATARPSPESLLSKKHVHTDSGYGSNSGPTSATMSNGDRFVPPMSKTSKDNSIQNYLHDIPDALLPQRPVVMSERARMAVVVRKLEQLFTGKEAKPGLHRQPVQQQEISQLAAQADLQADRTQNEKRRAEGTREARILPHDANMNFDTGASPPGRKTDANDTPLDSVMSQHDFSVTIPRDHSPDQRPTHPLDLDIDRSVVPGENIDYIRHLGLSTSQLDEPHAESDNWIYLNLLVNMAQLHTINVTPDFVRRSIRKLSTKFEISKDGRQLRWKGGSEGTRFSVNEERVLECEPADLSETNEEAVARHRGSGSTTPGNSASTAVPSQTDERLIVVGPIAVSQALRSSSVSSNQFLSFHRQHQAVTDFDHKPLAISHRTLERRRGNLDPESDSVTSEPPAAQLRRRTCQADGSHIAKRCAENGTMIFYNDACFFSDLSFDKSPVNHRKAPVKGSHSVLGVPCLLDEAESPLRDHDACYFTPQFARCEFHENHGAVMTFSPTMMSAAGEDEVQPMELPVSGIGGTVPEDNFAVDVQIERVATKTPIRHDHASSRSMVRSHYEYHVCNTNRIDLRPAQLPSPSYLVFSTDSSSDSSESESGSESESSDVDDSLHPARSGFLSGFLRTQEETVDSASDDGRQDTESIDMLEAARAVDPRIVAAQEREYTLHHLGGVNVVVESLTATVGAGSRSSTAHRDVQSVVGESGSAMSTNS